MDDWILGLAESLAGAAWLYPVLAAMVAADALLPLLPAESMVVVTAVFSALPGGPWWGGVAAAAAVGAFTGDHTGYALGRRLGPRVHRRFPASSRTGRALLHAEHSLHRRGGLVLVVARYVPAGRTAVTLAAGAVGYPLRRFTPFAALAAVTWALFTVAVGYVGGLAFQDQPLAGLLLGLGLAVLISLVVELVRWRIRRRRRSSTVWTEPVDE